jgi:hypothetical protein
VSVFWDFEILERRKEGRGERRAKGAKRHLKKMSSGGEVWSKPESNGRFLLNSLWNSLCNEAGAAPL